MQLFRTRRHYFFWGLLVLSVGLLVCTHLHLFGMNARTLLPVDTLVSPDAVLFGVAAIGVIGLGVLLYSEQK